MIVCQNCHHKNLPGALFCNECGAQLVTTTSKTTQSLVRAPSDALDVSEYPELSTVTQAQKIAPRENAESVVSLHLMEIGKMINLTGKNDYTLGRVSEGQPIIPDIDLSPYDAYSQGVSRLHASLKVATQQISILDLGSSNGTRVNGQKIVAHVEYPLNHGDVVSLGKFKIQILVHY